MHAPQPREFQLEPLDPAAQIHEFLLPGLHLRLAHLPRESVIHAPEATCAQCGTTMQRIGEDVAEMLEYVPARFKVIRQVRPKLSCACCQRIVQLPAPIRPIDRGIPGPGLLAHVAVSKFADSLPLYRQAQIYAREGVELERS